jgi:hypothetical protein
LTFLLLSLTKANNVQAGCFYTQTINGLPAYNSIFANGSDSLQFCQALACQIFPGIQGCPNVTPPPPPVTCTYSAQTENRSCPINYSGSQTWKKETNCPTGSYGQPVQTDWFKIQDSCVLGDYIRHLQEVDKQSYQPRESSKPAVSCKYCYDIGYDASGQHCTCVDGNKQCPDSGRVCNERDCPDECLGDHDGFSDNLDYTGIPTPKG